ncbi:hypothetical protein BH09VER1_BH09VER1_09490 [soil metagenome]
MKESESKSAFFDYRHLGMGFLATLVAAVAFALLLTVGAVLNPRQFAFSYLFAWLFFFTIAVGAQFWTILHHAVDAEWSVVVRRQLENIGALIVPLVILFLPLIFFAPQLWSWMSPAHSQDPLLVEKRAYLNVPFFWLRTVVYLACFTTGAILLRRYSIAQDREGAPHYTMLNRRVSFACGIPFALCLTFASVDWIMSLDFRWSSSIWGVYLFSGAVLAALALLIVVVTALRPAGLSVVTLEHYHIMGKLVLSFTIFWAYIAYSQYVVIWYANIPEETSYFLVRTTGSWWALSQFLVVGSFFIPFLVLLFRKTKRRPALLCALAAWLLLMHGLDLYIIILPCLHPGTARPSVWDFVSLLALGSILAVVFLKRLGDSALYPVRDPRLAQSLALKD